MSNLEQRPADCFICRKHRGEVFVPGGAIYEDDLVFAYHVGQEGQPAYLGYLMVETRRHVAGLADLTNDEAQEALCSKLRSYLEGEKGLPS